MNYKFEFKEEEMDLVMEALMLYILRVDKEKKDTLIALFKRMMNKLIDERKKEVETKPKIKQYDILKPNKNVKFVALDEVVENFYEIDLDVFERMISTAAIKKCCKSSERKNKNKDEMFLHSLPEFTLQKKFDISNKNFRDMVDYIYKIKMTKDETKVLYVALGNLRTNDLHSVDRLATHGKTIKLMDRIKEQMSSEWKK